jgi:hypothetical protein
MNQIECLTELLYLSKEIARVKEMINDCQLSNNTREYAKELLKTNYQYRYDSTYKTCYKKIKINDINTYSLI